MMNNLKDIWKTTLAQIEVKIDSAPHFKTWFQPTELLEVENGKAKIGVRNSYTSEWLARKHLGLIEDTLSYVAGVELKVEFEIAKDLVNVQLETVSEDEQQESILTVHEGINTNFEHILSQANIVSDYSFNNFVTGPSNRLAHAATMAVSENPGTTYNPLFIYGETGLGKTHLAHAVARGMIEKQSTSKILYKPSENFLNEMVNAIKSGRTRDFRAKYRFLDLLIIDDIQLISKWEQTQDELFNTFNALHSKNKQIILVSDRPPEKIHNLESRLKSRFQGGMVVQVEKPDYETRLAILNHKVGQFNINLPENVLDYIAQNTKDNVRHLEGNLQQVSLMSRIHTHDITVEEVANILGTDPSSKREKTKPKDVMKYVAKEFQVTTKDILSRTRKADIAFARQVVMYLLREDFNYKLEDIANFLNRKDHTTVIHAVDKVKSKAELEKGFQDQLDRVREEFS